jgi:hypothetical protein
MVKMNGLDLVLLLLVRLRRVRLSAGLYTLVIGHESVRTGTNCTGMGEERRQTITLIPVVLVIALLWN